MKTIAAWLNAAAAALAGTSETPTLDAQVLLAHNLEKPRTWILAHPEVELNSGQANRFNTDLERLQNGESLPYILGRQEFFGLNFLITPEVLIPRPETELVVEEALGWLRQHPGACRAIDVGTGSGCLAITLAVHLPNLHILATDRSWAALNVARQNAERHGVSNCVDFLQADLLSAIQVTNSSFHLLAANLPYIPTETLQDLPVYGNEPTLALDGGPGGTELIGRLLRQAPARLHPEGLLLLEIEYRQGQKVLQLAQEAFPHARVNLLPDLAGHDRVIKIDL
jgi:release factor glutamine methyltransferase